MHAIGELGASAIFKRNADLVEAIGMSAVDVIVDLVAGSQWPSLLDILRPGGRYTVAGAIGGSDVRLDVRTLYLKDLTLFGCTVLEPGVFERLIDYIEAESIQPIVAEKFALRDLVAAQNAFLKKHHVGKLVVEPNDCLAGAR
jgi:NADPH:quinone reductase-like Zn-dependent oxidoreductase